MASRIASTKRRQIATGHKNTHYNGAKIDCIAASHLARIGLNDCAFKDVILSLIRLS